MDGCFLLLLYCFCTRTHPLLLSECVLFFLVLPASGRQALGLARRGSTRDAPVALRLFLHNEPLKVAFYVRAYFRQEVPLASDAALGLKSRALHRLYCKVIETNAYGITCIIIRHHTDRLCSDCARDCAVQCTCTGQWQTASFKYLLNTGCRANRSHRAPVAGPCAGPTSINASQLYD